MVNVTMGCNRLLESETQFLVRSLLKQLLFDKNLIDSHKALRDGRFCRWSLRGTVSALCCRTWGDPEGGRWWTSVSWVGPCSNHSSWPCFTFLKSFFCSPGCPSTHSQPRLALSLLSSHVSLSSTMYLVVLVPYLRHLSPSTPTPVLCLEASIAETHKEAVESSGDFHLGTRSWTWKQYHHRGTSHSNTQTQPEPDFLC